MDFVSRRKEGRSEKSVIDKNESSLTIIKIIINR